MQTRVGQARTSAGGIVLSHICESRADVGHPSGAVGGMEKWMGGGRENVLERRRGGENQKNTVVQKNTVIQKDTVIQTR